MLAVDCRLRRDPPSGVHQGRHTAPLTVGDGSGPAEQSFGMRLLYSELMDPCFDAHTVVAALVNERLPFGTVPPAEVCIRLRGLSPKRLVSVCAEHGIRIVRVERQPFSDGEDTVYIVQTTSVLPA